MNKERYHVDNQISVRLATLTIAVTLVFVVPVGSGSGHAGW